MARPRKPPDPDAYPPCARCQLAYRPGARWPEGTVCGYCYQQAKRTRGTCHRCEHQGVLPGRTADGQPLCRRCSGITLNVDCVRCGKEDELPRNGLCWNCMLSDIVDSTFTGPDGQILPVLLPVAEALKGMRRGNSGVTWIRQPTVQELLGRLASGMFPVTHEAFDALPRTRTSEFVRDLLVEHRALSARDRNLAAYEHWLNRKLDRITDPEHRRVLERFGRWHHLRRLRRASNANGGQAVTLSALMNAKQSTTVALDFLTWLSEQDLTLPRTGQAGLDQWLAEGPSTRGRVDTFLYWAQTHQLIGSLEIPRRARGHGPVLGEDDRLTAIRLVLTDDDVPLATRVAAGLVLLFGQPVHRVAGLRTSQVTLHHETRDSVGGAVRIRLGRDAVDVPKPFAALLADLVGSRSNLQTAAHLDSPWLFPGYIPGQHLNPNHLAELLRRHGAPPLASRAGTWQQMVRDIPPTVLAETIGISPVTATRHADEAGTDYQRYAGAVPARRRRRPEAGRDTPPV